MELKRNDDNNTNQPYNGNSSYTQQNNPYGQGDQNGYYGQANQSNPYGQVNQSSPYGQPNQSNPYGQQNPYGQSNVYDPSQAYYTQRAVVNGQPYNNQAYGDARQSRPAALAAGVLETAVAKSFLYMFMALLVSGIVAFLTANPSSSAYNMLYGSHNMAPFIVCLIVEFVLVITCTLTIKKNNVMLSAILFFAFAVVNGLTLSVVLLVYQITSVAYVFFITAGIFGIMAFIGITTKKDLTSMGSICMMGLLGIILAGIVNMFAHSEGMDFAISIIGVIVFVGLTAYDAQKIKELAHSNSGLSTDVIGLYGAMTLYLDFINLFLKLLRLLGKKN